MFTRTHRIGRHRYTEALISYRDPDTGKPRHRCLARWRAGRTFDEELGATQFAIEHATKNLAYYQGVIDRTVRPKLRRHWKDAPKSAAAWRRWLAAATARHAALSAARAAGLPADDAAIERAARAEADRWAGMRSVFQPPAPPGLASLAERVRRLADQNDPDALRAEIAAIAAALDTLAA